MNRLSSLLAPALAAGFMISLAAQPATALDIKEGKWTIKSKSTSSVNGQVKERESSRCVGPEGFDPVTAYGKAPGCTVSDVNDTGSSVTWKLSCEMAPGGPKMTGGGRFNVDGNKVTGNLSINMSMQGMNIENKSEWVGSYQGPCSEEDKKVGM